MTKPAQPAPNALKPQHNRTARADEPVGYGRPPKAHRFKPGRSGNPSGKKRGTRNLRTDLADELAEIITVQEAGQASRLTKQRALVKRLCAQALSGEHRAMAQVVGLVLRLIPPGPGAADQNGEIIDHDDEAIIQRFLARAHRAPPVRTKKPERRSS